MDSPTPHADSLSTDRGDAGSPTHHPLRAAEQATREKNDALALLDAVLESAPVGFALLDRALRIVRVNTPMAEFIGRAPEEQRGRPLRDVMPEHASTMHEMLARVIETGTPETNVAMTGTTSGTPGRERSWLASAFPIRGTAGIDGAGLIITDTTERKALEGQLLQAQKMEAVGRLAGGIAHDFNNMLTAVMSYSDLLMHDLAETDPRREDVMEIASAARRAAGLTRQLLAFSRRQVLEAWPLDLNATVTEIEKMLGRIIGADIRVVTRLEPKLGIVKADPGQIEQVLLNLAVNARDAMPEGGRLTIETANVTLDDQYARVHAVRAPGDYVMLAVSDTGTGMTPEVQARIFEPFFTTKERGKGTGLGLSTVYGIVTQSGGNVWVYSEVNRGTTFRIYLPRVDAAPAAPAPSEHRPPKHEGSEVILLVEDDVAVRTVLGRILRAAGYAVLEASNGAEAMHICENPTIGIDLIITDVVMPEMGGREFARLLHALRPTARMLFMSGYSEERLPVGGTEAPAAFIEKPFTMDALARKVRELLDPADDAGDPR